MHLKLLCCYVFGLVAGIKFCYFLKFIHSRHEIKAIRASCFVMGLLSAFGRFGTKLAVFASVVSYVLQNGRLTAEEVFVVTAYFNILKHVMTESFPLAVIEVAESTVSIKRVQAFLLNEEVASAATQEGSCGKITTTLEGSNKPCECRCSLNDTELVKDPVNTKISDKITTVDTVDRLLEKTGGPTSKKSIVITNVTAKWMEDLPKNTLTDVSLDVRPGELVAVVGPVGSGKTSLLHAILKELPLNSGSISVGGSVSYASQEPWLFTGSVRQNILFGQPMDRNRYRQVVRVCALERDFQLLPHGDRTIVGERGVTLSGGQRARISLARAIYKEADIYLLDDPLSAVDTRVGRHLFEDCICGFLVGKTRVLVTHQLQYLHTADDIIILNNGAVEAVGTFTKLQNSGLDFAKQLELEVGETMDDNLNRMSARSSDDCVSQCSANRLQHQNSGSSEVSSVAGSIPEMAAEMQARGSVGSRVYWVYFSAGGNCMVILLVFGLCVLSQLAISGGDYWMSYWSTVEEHRLIMSEANSGSSQNVTGPIVNDTASYQDSNSGYSATTDVAEWGWLPSRETCIYVYSGLVASVIILSVCSVICFFTMCMRASINLHNAMFTSITRATMRFFNSNPSGQILNRFSKDMGTVDEIVPLTMIDCIQIGLSLLGIIVVVAVVNVWLLIPAAVMFLIFCILRVYFVATSRSVKRLEGITRSPVFSHLSASLQGLTTIRALGAQAMLEKEFDGHQDLHSSAWYMFITTTRAFSVWLDSTCLLYIIVVTFSFFIMSGDQYGGSVGLAITQAVTLTGLLQWGIRQSAELETQMTSVERVLEYSRIEKEPSLESPPGRKPKDDWPSQGVIMFDKVFLTYSKDEPPVLKNVSFVLRPAEKVGVVGRTGAGKSSLIAALFRLADISSGQIQIDGIDIASIGLHDLRSKISIIPQEPVLFSGSLRENLDPFSEYSDAALWAALAEVELKQVVDELPAGLSHRVSEGGSNFSVGQRQLLCLARAIIRNNKILVLDEATANVDPQTDELIQATVRDKFADCTVLTIAHRLHTVMDSDRIVIMDAGHVVKFDHPHLLLTSKHDVLYQMVQQMGPAMAESLCKMAQASYKKYLEKKKKHVEISESITDLP
ncbi:hypothetical protein B7P43_G17381 [Cryptotermes secundus]|uniref:Multidrug resistance-associated protein lethal(2)03659 n=1 Tax=Cryptotermes secundus TaxID=105785 RepID=A0A2J7QE00_9NEOP|nr:hypothetical protein B7P43_G17381 [Cryptotermes secundus]